MWCLIHPTSSIVCSRNKMITRIPVIEIQTPLKHFNLHQISIQLHRWLLRMILLILETPLVLLAQITLNAMAQLSAAVKVDVSLVPSATRGRSKLMITATMALNAYRVAVPQMSAPQSSSVSNRAKWTVIARTSLAAPSAIAQVMRVFVRKAWRKTLISVKILLNARAASAAMDDVPLTRFKSPASWA